jgi:hypothetical protein
MTPRVAGIASGKNSERTSVGGVNRQRLFAGSADKRSRDQIDGREVAIKTWR